MKKFGFNVRIKKIAMSAVLMVLTQSLYPGIGYPADNATSPPRPTVSRVIALGTLAGPFPSPTRAQFSNLLTVNGKHYVIDAGDGVVRRLAEAKVKLQDIGTIFITHHHDDHTGGLGMLMSAAWDRNRTAPINVYGPPKTKKLIDAAAAYYKISADIRIKDGGRTIPIETLFHGHDVLPGTIYQDENIKVTAVANTHFDFHKDAKEESHEVSYSLKFETPDRTYVFTGDTGPNKATEQLAAGADILFSEVNVVEERKQILIDSGQWQKMTPQEQERIMRQAAYGHMTTRDIGEMATRAKIKAVVLTHLTPRGDGNDDYSAWADEVKRYYSGPVTVAKDLMAF
jgi:ribonuclease BN (tRNA processing enzyme)